MQFLRECAQGSQAVDDFTSFEKTARKIYPALSEMDQHVFDGNFRKCKENHDKQNPGLGRKIWDGAQTAAPYLGTASTAISALQDPAIGLQVAKAADSVFRFFGIDILKGI